MDLAKVRVTRLAGLYHRGRRRRLVPVRLLLQFLFPGPGHRAGPVLVHLCGAALRVLLFVPLRPRLLLVLRVVVVVVVPFTSLLILLLLHDPR